MAISDFQRQKAKLGLNASEQARTRLGPIVSNLLVGRPEAGYEVESIFSMFWNAARQADDMMDYSRSSDMEWLKVLQQIFLLCSKVQDLPSNTTPEAWIRTSSYFFNLMSETCKGEVEDLIARKPSLSNYNRMVLQKTGPWFTGRIACTAIATGRTRQEPVLRDLELYGNFVSLAYQIRNDIKDIETDGKDIAIGKVNLPSVLLVQKRPELLLKSRISRAVYYEHGVIEQAEIMAQAYENKSSQIAQKYGFELESLTRDLCSSRS